MKISKLAFGLILLGGVFAFAACGSSGDTSQDSGGGGGGGDTSVSYSSSLNTSSEPEIEKMEEVQGYPGVYKFDNRYYGLYENVTLEEALEKADSEGAYLVHRDHRYAVKNGFVDNGFITMDDPVFLGVYRSGSNYRRADDSKIYEYDKSDSNYNINGLNKSESGNRGAVVLKLGINDVGTERYGYYAVDSSTKAYAIVYWPSLERVGVPITGPYRLSVTDISLGDLAPAKTKIYKFGDEYFAYFTDKKSWTDAEAYCEELGGRLLIAKDNFDKVYALINESQGYDYQNTWIGLARYKDRGTITTEKVDFKWISGGTLSEGQWAPNQPDYSGNQENCVHYYDQKPGYWNDAVSSKLCNFICQWYSKDEIGKPHKYFFYNDIISNQASLLSALSKGTGRYLMADDVYLDDSFTYVEKFAGTIYGNGHTISIPNKAIDHEKPYNFIKELTGSLKNINFELDVSITDSFSNFGGVVHTNNGTIDGCTVKGEINAPNVGHIGGFAYNGSGKFVNNTNEANIVGDSYVAGIASELTKCTYLERLKNKGNITGKNYLGGIVGKINDEYGAENVTVTFTNLTNQGEITGVNYVGGIFGYIYTTAGKSGSYPYPEMSVTFTIKDSKNLGAITAQDYVGGIVGYATGKFGTNAIDNCMSSSTVTARTYVGCIAGYLINTQVKNCDNTDSELVVTEASLDGTTKISYVGGYVGRGYSVSDCTNEIDISVPGQCVGGVIGWGNGNVSNCTNDGDITSDEGNFVGGVAGFLRNVTSVKNLNNFGEIKGVNAIGGVIGKIEDDYGGENVTLAIADLRNEGAVTGTNYVAGIIGYIYSNATKSASYPYPNCVVTIQMDRNDNIGTIKGEDYVGGIIGYALSETTDSYIQLCNSYSRIEGRAYVGCIAGYLSNIKVIKCSNKDSELVITGVALDGTNKVSYVGGYVGKGYSVKECVNAIDVNARGRFVGGLIGWGNGNIEECANSGKVTSESDYIGGIAGYLNSVTSIKTSNNYGDVKGNDCVGGIVGKINDDFGGYDYTLVVSDSKNEGAITGNNYVSGIVGYIYSNATKSAEYPYTDRVVTIKFDKDNNLGTIKGQDYVSGILSYSNSETTASYIQLCNSSSRIEGRAYVGCIAGYLNNVQILNCSNEDSEIVITGTILDGTTKKSYVGGYVGRGYVVKNCDNALDISAGGQNVGGIVGWGHGNIENCNNTGNITGQEDNVGGIGGWLQCITSMKKTTNSGDITGKNYVGGIVGRINDDYTSGVEVTLTVTELSNEGSVASENYAGGIVAYVYGNQTKASGYPYNDCSVNFRGSYLTNSGEVTGADGKIGGILGYAKTDGTSGYVIECSSTTQDLVKYGQLVNITDQDA